MDSALVLLRAYLEKPPPRTNKAPRGLDRELKATYDAAVAGVGVVLLKAGFQAWYAYFAAEPVIRATVDTLPLSDVRSLGEELCAIVPHSDVQELFHHLLQVADRRFFRINLIEAYGGRMPLEISSRKRRRIVPTPDMPEMTIMAAPISASPALVSPNPVQQYIQVEPDPAQGPSTVAQGEILPLATHLSSILPPSMLGSIVKNEGWAKVEIIQSESAEPPQLRLSIYPSSIPHLAQRIFDVECTIKDMCLYLTLENGANAKVLELSGARHDTLERCFGEQVATAVRSTRKFSTEVEQGRVVTHCVSLRISRDIGFTCSISLLLDPASVPTIRAKIWPPVRG